MPEADPWLTAALGRLRTSSSIVAGLRVADDLASAAARSNDPLTTVAALRPLVADADDEVAAIAAVHALSAASGPAATDALTALLADDRRWVAEHASWALSARAIHRPALTGLVRLTGAAGFGGMLAQRTLAGWSTADPPAVLIVMLDALRDERRAAGRRLLTEILGTLGGGEATDRLVRLATDRDEDVEVRAAAVAGLGRRAERVDLLVELANRDDTLSEHALLALADRDRPDRRDDGAATDGVRIGQLHLQDDGGVATLLGLLSATFAERSDVAEVWTLGRGSVTDVLVSPLLPPDTHRTVAVPFGGAAPVDLQEAWPWRLEIERGIRRALAATGPLDALHLRMADVGTLAASRVARQRGVPVVFTAAPDPHVVLETAEIAGTLDRSNGGRVDAVEHWWFRARMVERLAAQADGVTLLPRADVRRTVGRLLGVELEGPRVAVVPEGVHAPTVRRAERDVARLGSAWRSVGKDALLEAIDRLPPARRRLRLVVTVGRLHPVKGIGRLVHAWISDERLRATTNLVVIGGDLAAPTPGERMVLADIERITSSHGHTDGLILLGHRAHDEVARALSFAAGRSPSSPPCGIYVGGAAKEEFGLAIVEALAAGLPVVAPDAGGPPTYVEHGASGVLVDTTDPVALAAAMHAALAMADAEGRADRVSASILARFTIDRTADGLLDLYRRTTTA